MDQGANLFADRAVIAVTGSEAAAFLNRLLTNSVTPDAARFAALLTPQGKIITDFFVVPVSGEAHLASPHPEVRAMRASKDEPAHLGGSSFETPASQAPQDEGVEAAAASKLDGFLLDCPATRAAELVKRLTLQKLRAKIAIEDRSATLAVAAVWGRPAPRMDGSLVFADPRAENMGQRIIAPREALAASIAPDAAAYAHHRVAQGVPEGGIDFVYGDSFVQEANLDHTAGVDFKKGCYVGQEVVARVHFRRSARKRIVPVRFNGEAPVTGTPVMAGDTLLGTLGSVAGAAGLAMLRLDKLEDACAAGVPVTAAGVAIDVSVPAAFLDGAALTRAAS